MSTLPPLRTVRTFTPVDTSGPPGRAFDPVLNQPKLPALARTFLQELLDLGLTDPPALREFLDGAGKTLSDLTTRERVGQALGHAGTLTSYQRDRVVAGSTFGLVLGSYRVLDRLGGGSVGVVFLGEHVLLRRRVAIKVVPVDDAVSQQHLDRFHSEMRVLASINHPHVVSAYDAGVLPSPGAHQPALHYLVLEIVPGGDLEQYVYDHGPRPVGQACEWTRQVASGLQAAHDRHLTHRDLKPSNLLLTPDQRVKVIDFGLARELASTRTVRGSLIGSVEFMAPEQSADPTAVGPAADIYGLGVTLFWMLTGQLPHPRGRTTAETVKALQTGTPRRVREFRQDVPPDLDQFLANMLARNPTERPGLPEVMRTLTPYADELGTDSAAVLELRPAAAGFDLTPTFDPGEPGGKRLVESVRQLEASLVARENDVRRAEDAVLFAMRQMAASHDGGSTAHLRRMQEYVRVLAEHLCTDPDWPVLVDRGYVADLVRCVPLHDIGKIGLPDAILDHPEALTPEQREVVEIHPQLGCDILERLARTHGDSLTFLGMARAVVRSHHERWDGNGYPDRLAGQRIPPAARLVALADVYDALRRDRSDRLAIDHPTATEVILSSIGQFDPAVVEAFQACEQAFEQIHLTVPE